MLSTTRRRFRLADNENEMVDIEQSAVLSLVDVDFE